MKIKVFIIIFFIFFGLYADENTLYLTSLEWPPYTSSELYSKGLSSYIVIKAFEAEGYSVEIEFFPWSRAVYNAKTNSKYSAYFPEYYSEDLEKSFYFSNPIGINSLGFAERNSNKIVWDKLEDLKGKRIGIVQDYINTEEFDMMVRTKRLLVDVAINDRLNLLKLVGGRMDLAVVDENVLNYYLNYDEKLKKSKNKISFNPKLLSERELYVCFPKGFEGKNMLNIFNEGLKKIDIKKLEEEYRSKFKI